MVTEEVVMRTTSYSLELVALWPRLASFGLLLALALLIHAFGWAQPVSGPLANAVLLIGAELLGAGPAIALGALTPLGGLLHGVLPLPLAAMTPFIVLGNAVLVRLYCALRDRNRCLALLVAAVAKFALLFSAVTTLAVGPLHSLSGGTNSAMPAAMIHTMSWPQLGTALAGGLIAFAVLRILSPRVSMGRRLK
jgi:hypothetical protein